MRRGSEKILEKPSAHGQTPDHTPACIMYDSSKAAMEPGSSTDVFVWSDFSFSFRRWRDPHASAMGRQHHTSHISELTPTRSCIQPWWCQGCLCRLRPSHHLSRPLPALATAPLPLARRARAARIRQARLPRWAVPLSVCARDKCLVVLARARLPDARAFSVVRKDDHGSSSCSSCGEYKPTNRPGRTSTCQGTCNQRPGECGIKTGLPRSRPRTTGPRRDLG